MLGETAAGGGCGQLAVLLPIIVGETCLRKMKSDFKGEEEMRCCGGTQTTVDYRAIVIWMNAS